MGGGERSSLTTAHDAVLRARDRRGAAPAAGASAKYAAGSRRACGLNRIDAHCDGWCGGNPREAAMNWSNNPVFGSAITLAAYGAAIAMQKRITWAHPLVVTVGFVIAFLVMGKIPEREYQAGGA